MHRRLSLASAALSLAITTQLFAGYAARDSWLPIAGHTAIGLGGRAFYTTVYVSDVSRSRNEVTLSFYASEQPHVPPRTMTVTIAPNQTAAIDVGPQLTGEGAVGALHIESARPVIADARVYSRSPNAAPATELGTVVNAIPSHLAIGTGESALLHVPAGARYKIYAVETQGFPLYFSVMAAPDANERRLYLAANEHRSWDIDELFRGTTVSSLRIAGINGSGKIVALGTAIQSQSQDFTTWEMSLPARPRHRLLWPEVLAYVTAAVALAIAAIVRLRT